MAFVADNNVYINTEGDENTSVILGDIISMGNLLPVSYFIDTVEDPNLKICIIKENNGIVTFDVNGVKCDVDINTAFVYCCIKTNKLSINEKMFNKFGLELFGKIKWNAYSEEEKKYAVEEFVKNNANILEETGITQLTGLIGNNITHKNICERYIRLYGNKLEMINIDTIKYINELITHFNNYFKYDICKNVFYTDEIQRHAKTNIGLLDKFLSTVGDGNTDTFDDSSLDILNYITETYETNKLFKSVEELNSVYGNLIANRLDFSLLNADKDDCSSLINILNKVPSRLIPCLGKIQDSKKLFKLYNNLDYKYLKVTDVSDMYSQLYKILRNETEMSDKTRYLIVYHLEKIKNNTVHLYSWYRRLDQSVKPTNVKNYNTQFLENVKNLINDIGYNIADCADETDNFEEVVENKKEPIQKKEDLKKVNMNKKTDLKKTPSVKDYTSEEDNISEVSEVEYEQETAPQKKTSKKVMKKA